MQILTLPLRKPGKNRSLAFLVHSAFDTTSMSFCHKSKAFDSSFSPTMPCPSVLTAHPKDGILDSTFTFIGWADAGAARMSCTNAKS